MRYAILSDIHANLEAFEAAMADAQDNKCTHFVCLGDVVGYGADPNAMVDWVRQDAAATVRGNHDKAAAGLDDMETFSPLARASALWTRTVLTPSSTAYLERLPRGPVPYEGCDLVHGSPADEDEYLVAPEDTLAVRAYLDAQVTFFGHTHVQGAFMVHRNGIRRMNGPVIELENDVMFLLNPGSVGQPRDGDPRAAYAIYDTDQRTVTFSRAEYDIQSTQADILRAGLPEILAYRLQVGR